MNPRSCFRLASLLLSSLLWVGSAQAAIFVVDSTGDGGDMNPGNGVCRAPGNVCTLRAALEEANALPGLDVITFNIAPAGPKTLSPASALPDITFQVTIDGTTQPGYAGTPIIELDGSMVSVVLRLSGAGSSGSTIRGLVINRAGTGIEILGSSNNVIAGNFLGTNVAGTAALGNVTGGIHIGGNATASNNNRIGGTLAADRNVISGNTDGIAIGGLPGAATNNLVQGNYIGLDVTGTAALGNTNQGVSIYDGAANNTIGGTAAGARNVISANGNGIFVTSGGTDNLVQGNFIGTNAAGTAPVANFRGVAIDGSASGNQVGGTAAGASNRIAFNQAGGVVLPATAGAGNQILSNQIYSNGSLGIDLNEDLVTANDAGDADAGPNNLQNYPVLTAASTDGASTNITGSFNGAPSATYRIEFFASSATDPSGFGEGERFLGFENITTNAAGDAVIGVTLGTTLFAGEFVTATATDSSNNTSEFSAAVLVAVSSLVVTTTADTTDGDTTSVSALIADPGADGRISLREALVAANNTPGTDTIRFGIPPSDTNHLYYRNDAIAGSLSVIQATTLTDAAITDFDPDYPAGMARSWYRIQPTSSPPVITDAVVLDAATQPGFIPGGPVIELNGAAAGTADGLALVGASGSTIRGFVVNQFLYSGIGILNNNNVIEVNFVGTGVAGIESLGNGYGISLTGGSNNRIGGTGANSSNRIAFNNTYGIAIGGTATGNSVLTNSIFSNVNLGIDLLNNGVTPNDALDVDSGPNDLLNFPVLTSGQVSGGAVTVNFQLDVPAGAYRIEFFRNPSGADPSGNGEGGLFAGSVNVTHPGGGALSFNHSFPGVIGDVVTATTTACADGAPCTLFGSTSEFSSALTAVAGPLQVGYRSIGTAPNRSTATGEGTVAATNGSTLVTGAGTSWVTWNRGRGDVITINGTDYMVQSVDSQTQLRLARPFAGPTGSGKSYVIARQFTTLDAWETCISGGACAYFPVASANLAADNRTEIGIAYKDSVFILASDFRIQGSTTDASHRIVLTADPGNRHNGVPGAGAMVNNNGANEVDIRDSNVTVEWLELIGASGANISPIQVFSTVGPPLDEARNVLLQNLLIHNFADAVNDVSGIDLAGDNNAVREVTIRNCMIWNGDRDGIEGDGPLDALIVENVSIDGMARYGIHAQESSLTIRNTIVTGSGLQDFNPNLGSLVGSNNTSSDGSASFGANAQTGVTAASVFVAPGSDLHLKPGANPAVNSGLDLSGSFSIDVDGQSRAGTWDRGADEIPGGGVLFNYRSIGTASNRSTAGGDGTVSATNGSTVVTGSGTSWVTWNRGRGDVITIDATNYMVLSVDSQTQLTLATSFTGSNGTGKSYTIARQFTTLTAWETCISGGACAYFPVATANLVVDNRSETGIAYNDSVFALTSTLQIQGSTTDASHRIVLTADPGNRHNGVPGAGVVVNNNGANEVDIRDSNVTVEWLELVGANGSAISPIQVFSTVGPPVDEARNVLLQNLLVHSFVDPVNDISGIDIAGDNTVVKEVTIRNCMLWNGDYIGIEGDGPLDIITIENVSIDGMTSSGIYAATSPLTIRNTIVTGSGLQDFSAGTGSLVGSNNTSSDGTASFGPNAQTGVAAASVFVTPGSDLHLKPGANPAVNSALDLSASFSIDVDGQSRAGTWDRGADELLSGGGPFVSSAANQTFVVGTGPQVSAVITITDDSVVPAITAANDIRLVIPSGFPMRWDPSVASVTLGGTASSRVSPLVKAFEDFGQTVVLDVFSNFDLGETLTVTGLRFFSFTAPASPDNLELEVDNNDTTAAVNDKTVQIVPDSIPNLSSHDDQLFLVGSLPVPMVPLTVSEGATPSITELDDIRIRIPSTFDMTWESSDLSASITGTAATKVSSTVSYEPGDKILIINVQVDFEAGEFITVSGLSFANFLNPEAPARLELVVDTASVIDLDDKRIQIDEAADVPFFTATATNSQVKLEWVYPAAGDCDFVRILVRDDGFFPGPLDGFPARLVGNFPCGAPGAKGSTVDGSLFNDTTYSYSAYVDHGGLFTPGKFVRSRPFATPVNVKWAYSTGATSMAPPGIRFKNPDSFVYAVSNDGNLHSMRGGAAGGDWPSSWKPNRLGAPAQARPPVVSFTVGASTGGAAFLGSQDGHVHAVRADTGATEWKQQIASMVQAAPAGNFLVVNPAAFDLVLVGTRNGSTPNSLKALDAHTGNPAWSFVNSSLQGGDDKAIGVISAGATVDYLNALVYFASRARAGGSSNTLWCVNFDGTSANLLWAKPLGDIDGSPVLFNGRLYVGTNSGVVRALNPSSGATEWSLPLGDGPIKGFVFPQFGSSNLLVSTTNNVWSIADNITWGSVNPGWPVTVASPSIPLYVPGTMKVLVGSSDGSLYQMDAVNPLPASSVVLGDGTAAVGAPTMDILKSMIYVGTDAGVIYGVAFPLP